MLPAVCKDGEHVVLGSPFSLGEGMEATANPQNCSFWDWKSDPSVVLQIGESWTRQGNANVPTVGLTNDALATIEICLAFSQSRLPHIKSCASDSYLICASKLADSNKSLLLINQ